MRKFCFAAGPQGMEQAGPGLQPGAFDEPLKLGSQVAVAPTAGSVCGLPISTPEPGSTVLLSLGAVMAIGEARFLRKTQVGQSL